MSDSSARLNNAVNQVSDPSLRLGRLPSPSRESNLSSLFSNLRDFLVERPVKLRAGTPTAFDIPRFGTGMGENLKEFFHSGPRGNVRSTLLVDWHEEPSLWANLRDWIAPRKLPPLKTTSQPIPVPEIWSKNTQFSRVQVVSILVHALAIALIVILPLLLPSWLFPPVTKAVNIELATMSLCRLISRSSRPRRPKRAAVAARTTSFQRRKVNCRSSPGRRSRGRWCIRRNIATIAVTPTVLGNPDIHLPNNNLPNWGDPLGKGMNDSMGQGHGSGVGNGNGSGVGPGEGWNTGGGAPNAGTGGYGTPACLYCPRADYSDEAMKVKVQGVVELIAVITPDGRVTDVHVAKGLGLGLDEKAIEAVRTWRLKPALGPDGRPASVRQIIEVTFQLY